MTDANAARMVMLCATILSLILNAHYLLFNASNLWAIDFHVFWTAASRDASELYVSSNSPFVYPPTAIAFFKPLALLNFEAGYAVWTVLSAALFAIVVTRLAGWRVALFSFFSSAALQGLVLGQTPMILSAALLFAITLPGIACGLIFGVVAAIKPQLLLLAPLAFAVRRDWRALGGMAAGLSGCVIVELALYGPHLWVDWFNASTAFREALFRTHVTEKVITPYGVADHLGLNPIPFLVVSAALAIAALVVSARRIEGIYLVAAIVGASILVSPYALRHDTIALVPACVAFMLANPSVKALGAVGIFTGWMVDASLLATAAQQYLVRRFAWTNFAVARESEERETP